MFQQQSRKMSTLIAAPVLVLLLLHVWRASLRRRSQLHRTHLLSLLGTSHPRKKLVVGFFHPYCNAGGGGERVLWTAVALHQRTQPDTICAIYTGDIGITKTEMMEKVKLRFGIHLDPNSLLLIHLKLRYLVESCTWPRFTLLGQSFGSILLGYEALGALIPDIYIDTMGYAFTFPVFRLLCQVPVGAYVHYPTISTDMLHRVSQRNAAHNNSSTISNSIILSYAKLMYYKIFAEIYSICLNQADHLMVNSTWTKNHIDGLLTRGFFNGRAVRSEEENKMETTNPKDDANYNNTSEGLRSRKLTKSEEGFSSPAKNPHDDQEQERKSRTRVIFPPCDVESFLEFPLRPRSKKILSISQFRPEKDQKTQIESFAKFLSSLSKSHLDRSSIKLVLAGSCRDHSDEERVVALKELARKLGVADQVEFKVNISWEHLKTLLSESLVGLSTMVDEHFGISIVEFMASGLIPLAHSSGGPLLDIIVPIQTKDQQEITGFHANGVDDYSAKLVHIFQDLNNDEVLKIQSNARHLVAQKFSVTQFETHWSTSFHLLRNK